MKHAVPQPVLSAQPTVDPARAAAIGAELAAARMRLGLDIETCAHRLSTPAAVLRRLESGALGPLDHGVFLRGHLRSYGALLGLPDATLNDYVQALVPQTAPPLLASRREPRSGYLFERYLRGASAMVITVAIAAPLVWLALHLDHGPSSARLEAIDSAPVTVAHAPGAGGSELRAPALPGSGSLAAAASVALPRADTAQQQPLLAAMTPFVGLHEPAADSDAAPSQAASRYTLGLQLSAPAWVEVHAADGQRLVYALLQPGHYDWHSDGPLQVLIGNASAAQVSVNGRALALSDINASNVVHFSVPAAAASAGAP